MRKGLSFKQTEQVQSVKAKRPCAEYKPSRQGYCKEHARRKAELNCRLPQGKKNINGKLFLLSGLKELDTTACVTGEN